MRRQAKIRAQLIRTRNRFAHLFERRVSILFDQVTVRSRKLTKLRRINDQFATLFDDAAQLITGLTADPEFIVMTVEQRNHALVLSSNMLDVNFAADICGAPERFIDVSGKKRVSEQPRTIAG